jgi:hypothetical protein
MKQNEGGVVKNLAFKLSLAALIVCSGLLTGNVAIAADECSKELLLEYFPKQFVVETLKKFNVPQDKWDAITEALSTKDKDVVKIVEDKASKLTPNPLKDRDPQQRQVAVKLFRETLLQVFSEALQANGVSDEKQYQGMLDDIQQQKARNFAQCMEKQKNAAQQQAPAGAQSRPEAQQPESEQQPAASPQARLEGDDASAEIAVNDHDDEDKNGDDDEESDDKEDNDKKDQGKA